MRILALETSSRSGSVALLVDQSLRASKELPLGAGTAQILVPTIAETLEQIGWKAAEIDLVAVTVGPGSFTGLRIGVTTAKTMAYSVGAQTIGVNTLEVIAAQASGQAGRVCAVIDAQRQQLFAATFDRDASGHLIEMAATAIVDADRWLDQLDAETLLTGIGLVRLAKRLPDWARVAPQAVWQPRAETVGRIALQGVESGQNGDFWKLVPQYYRESAAEEKLSHAPRQ